MVSYGVEEGGDAGAGAVVLHDSFEAIDGAGNILFEISLLLQHSTQ